MATLKKKRKDLKGYPKREDKVSEHYYDKKNLETNKFLNRQGYRRYDEKGIVKGRESTTRLKVDNPEDNDYVDRASTFKEVNVGPFSYRRSTEGTKKKGKKHTDFMISGKSVYNKGKDISPEKAEKIHAKMQAKLKKRKKKQDNKRDKKRDKERDVARGFKKGDY